MGQPLFQNEERDAFVLDIHRTLHNSLHLHAIALCKQYGYDLSYAGDFLQEVYRKLLSKYPAIASKIRKHGTKYLFGMIRNEVLSAKRKDKSLARIHKVFGEAAPKEARLHCYCVEEAINRLLYSIERLVTEQDLEILRHYLHGYSTKETGELLSMKPSTVGVRIHRAKLRLAPYFSGRGS